MNQLIPFKKDIVFETKISDIISISMEHKFEKHNNLININFIISGEYKVVETSANKEIFNYTLPFEINIDEKYNTDDINVDIDDFYYEIINNEILRINITVLLDNLKLNKTENEKLNDFSSNSINSILDIEEISDINENENIEEISDINENKNVKDKNNITKNIDERNNNMGDISNESKYEEKNDEVEEKELFSNKETGDEIVNSIFGNIDLEESFYTYHVYIVREGDTINNILEKYNVTKEELESYNNLNNLNIGDKIIIPDTKK